MRIFAVPLITIVLTLPVHANDCSSVLRLSAVSTGSTLNRDTFIQRATKFCDEYSKHKSRGTQDSLSGNYLDIGVSTSSGSSSVDAIASKYCKSESSKEINKTAYESFSNSIAPGGFDAYQACLKSGEEGLDFAVTSGLEKEATIALGFNSEQKNGIASIEIGPSNGIKCTASSDNAAITGLKLEMVDNSTVRIKCTRANSGSSGTISVIRFNSGQVDNSIGIPWAAYDNGVPISLVTRYEDAVAAQVKLATQLKLLESALSETDKRSKDAIAGVKGIEKGSLKKINTSNCKAQERPKSCGKDWELECPAGQIMGGVKNNGGTNTCAIAICCDYSITK